MKKTLLITIGVVIILALIAIWLYLMFYGTPKNTNEIFTNLGFSSDGAVEDFISYNEDGEALVEVGKKPLQQLTTRPVAGSKLTLNGNEKSVRYVERGTGYVYEINLNTGQETQITNTTIPLTTEAIFSPDGGSIVFTNYIEDQKISFVSSLAFATGTSEFIDSISLPPNADNITYATKDTILYTLSNSDGTVGYAFNLLTLVRTELFQIPIRQVLVSWGEGREHIDIYTKPATELLGFSYRLIRGELIPTSEVGMLALNYSSSNRLVFQTFLEGSRFSSLIYLDEQSAFDPGFVLLPEKCAYKNANSAEFLCAVPKDPSGKDFVEDWYKGVINTNDTLVLINSTERASQVLYDLSAEAGRPIDAYQLDFSDRALTAIFKNKIDDTLWLYDATVIAD